jgi:hypothetical protein
MVEAEANSASGQLSLFSAVQPKVARRRQGR